MVSIGLKQRLALTGLQISGAQQVFGPLGSHRANNLPHSAQQQYGGQTGRRWGVLKTTCWAQQAAPTYPAPPSLLQTGCSRAGPSSEFCAARSVPVHNTPEQEAGSVLRSCRLLLEPHGALARHLLNELSAALGSTRPSAVGDPAARLFTLYCTVLLVHPCTTTRCLTLPIKPDECASVSLLRGFSPSCLSSCPREYRRQA